MASKYWLDVKLLKDVESYRRFIWYRNNYTKILDITERAKRRLSLCAQLNNLLNLIAAVVDSEAKYFDFVCNLLHFKHSITFPAFSSTDKPFFFSKTVVVPVY